jgi:hypothetical protein
MFIATVTVPDLDPDLVKSFGSLRIRIHNTEINGSRSVVTIKIYERKV